MNDTPDETAPVTIGITVQGHATISYPDQETGGDPVPQET